MKIREGPVSDREKHLMTWTEDQTQNSDPHITTMIMAKTKSLFIISKDKACI